MGMLQDSVWEPIKRIFNNGQNVSPGYVPDSWQISSEEIHEMILGMTPADLYKTQPHLHTVISFIARNVAHCAPQVFERVSETDRRRVRDGALAVTLRRPNAGVTTFELVYGLVADLALYDSAYLHVVSDADSPSGWSLYRLPPTWVTPVGGDAFGFGEFIVQVPGGRERVSLPAGSVVYFHGWSPTDPRRGSAGVQALKEILAEQILAVRHRTQVWERGGRVSAVITRPAGTTWSDAARDAFRKDWRSRFTGDGPEAGGTPVLEDGMSIQKLGFSAHEQEFSDAAKLSLSTCASVYALNPVHVGVNEAANYSNVREFRKSLYGDSLGPIIAQLEDRLNSFLIPLIEPNNPDLYIEFNIAEKLQGNFEEQTAALSSSVGAPWMSRNEARARLNLPALDGGDDLVTPLNVLIGGQASPRDSAPKSDSPRRGIQVKARASEDREKQAERLVKEFFDRQERSVRSRLGAKADGDPAWWSTDRWDKELADDLMRVAAAVSEEVGQAVATSLGYRPEDYDVPRTLAFLRAVSDRISGAVNTATRQQIEDALKSDDPEEALKSVWTNAHEQRAAGIAAGVISSFSGFATVESAKQVTGGSATKTWITGPNPRPTHAAIDGETVGIDETFSNGAQWPADASLGADEVSNCNCSVEISTGV